MQTNYRVFYSDLFLLSQQDPGFYPIDQLIASDHYYPQGLRVTNFYNKIRATELDRAIFNSVQSNLGNYTGTSNTGAAFIKLTNRLTQQIKLDWGIRLESFNQLVSNVQYEYQESLKDAQLYTISLNSRTEKFNVLPHAKLVYAPIQPVQVFAAFSKTVHRPQLQELVNYRVYHPSSFLVQQGNPILENTGIDHYTAGINWIPKALSRVTIGGYYKKIERPVENVITNYFTGNLLSTPATRRMPKSLAYRPHLM